MILVTSIFEVYYFFFLSESFNYIGFKYDFSVLKYIEVKLLFSGLTMLSWYVFKKSHFLFTIYILLMLFFFIPNAILFAFMNHIRGPIYSNVLLIFLFMIISPTRLRIKTIRIQPVYQAVFVIVFSLLLLLPIILQFGSSINLKTLLLKEIYETREIFTGNSTTLINYIYNWEVKTIIPIVLVFFMIIRNYFFAWVAFFVLMYLYVISGNKSVYMTTIVTVFFCFVGRNYTSKINYLLVGLTIMLALIPIIDIFILKGFLLRGTFVMRVFFFPALLNYCYFDYFSDFSLYFSENSIFNLFSSTPLNTNSAYLIAQQYFNTYEMYANNGIISDGYMNLGYGGVVILSVVFSLIFMFFNSLNIDSRYFGIFLIYIFFILSAPFFTLFFTGGLWLLFLFSMTIMKSTSEIQ